MKRRSRANKAGSRKGPKKARLKTVIETILMELLQYVKIDFLILLALVCPPLAVFLVWGLHWRLVVNLCLCITVIGGQMNAVYALSQKGVLTKNRHRRRNANRMALEERAVADVKDVCKGFKSEPPSDVATEPGHPDPASS